MAGFIYSGTPNCAHMNMILEFVDGYTRVLGHRVYYKTIGKPTKGTVLCLHGGPGGSHWSCINMADIAPFGYKVVWYDQLGCGKSDRPASYAGYTIERSADEAEAVRQELGLGKCHLWGYSFGGALALQTILSHPKGFRSLTVTSGFASSDEVYREVLRLVAKLPVRVRRTIQENEAEGKLDDPKYVRAAGVFMRKHASDLKVPPFNIAISMASTNRKVAEAMNGESEAITTPATGTMASWDVTKKLESIHVPSLITAGARDFLTPRIARTINSGIAGSKLVVFRRSGHDAMNKERDLYVKTVMDFLDSVSRRGAASG